MKKEYLEIGKIVSTHGIKGEVRVQPWCDNPQILCKLDTLYFAKGKTAVKCIAGRVHKNIVILKLDGIDDIDAATACRNKVLYVHRDQLDLAPGSYFIQDILGMQVFDCDDQSVCYGEIVDVTKTGANDVYHIKNGAGKIFLIPAIPLVVRKIDIDNNRIEIQPLEGLFDDSI